ncbi:MAG: hypothetical protein AAGI25_02415 [Bacteroidota bacterium]
MKEQEMRTISEKKQELKEREEELRFQLDKSEEKLRNTAKSVAKIALLSGLLTLLGYWIYRLFFHHRSAEEEKKKKEKRKKSVFPRLGKLSEVIAPYLIRFFKEVVLELDKEKEDTKKKSK